MSPGSLFLFECRLLEIFDSAGRIRRSSARIPAAWIRVRIWIARVRMRVSGMRFAGMTWMSGFTGVTGISRIPWMSWVAWMTGISGMATATSAAVFTAATSAAVSTASAASSAAMGGVGRELIGFGKHAIRRRRNNDRGIDASDFDIKNLFLSARRIDSVHGHAILIGGIGRGRLDCISNGEVFVAAETRDQLINRGVVSVFFKGGPH